MKEFDEVLKEMHLKDFARYKANMRRVIDNAIDSNAVSCGIHTEELLTFVMLEISEGMFKDYDERVRKILNK